MISLCLAILSSSLVSIIMRLSGKRITNNVGMLAMNYIVCTLLAGITGGFAELGQPVSDATGVVLAMSVFNGAVYLAGFVLMQISIRRNGVVLSSVFQKLGLLVAMAVSVCIYKEVPTLLQGIGFLLAICAIIVMNYRKSGETAGDKAGLIWMLLACGMANAMSQVFAELGRPELQGTFLMVTFGSALVLCLALMVSKKQRIGIWEFVFGALIAVPNFFSSHFILGALETLSAVVVQPVYNVGSILVVTLAGLLAFRERLSRQQWIGVGVIVTALVLLNI